MVKSIQVPMMTATELEEHLEWEMDQYIPADVSEIYWDYHIPNTPELVRAGHHNHDTPRISKVDSPSTAAYGGNL